MAALLLVAVSFFKVAQHFKDPATLVTAPQVPEVAPELNTLLIYSKAMNDAQETLNEATHGNASGIDVTVQNLDSLPQLDPKADELRQRLKVLLQRAKTESLITPAPPAGKTEAAGKRTFMNDIVDWKKEYNQWLRTTGRRY